MLSIFNEGNIIRDVLFIADLLVICILNAGLVPARDGIQHSSWTTAGRPDELKLEIAGGDEGEHEEGQ